MMSASNVSDNDISHVFVGIDLSTRAVVCASVDEHIRTQGDIAIEIKMLTHVGTRHRFIDEGLRIYFAGIVDDMNALQVYVEHPPYVQNAKTYAQLIRVEHSVLIACHDFFTASRLHVHTIAPTEWRKLSLGNARAKKDELKAWLVDTHANIPIHKGNYTQDYVDAYCIAIAGRNEFMKGVNGG